MVRVHRYTMSKHRACPAIDRVAIAVAQGLATQSTFQLNVTHFVVGFGAGHSIHFSAQRYTLCCGIRLGGVSLSVLEVFVRLEGRVDSTGGLGL